MTTTLSGAKRPAENSLSTAPGLDQSSAVRLTRHRIALIALLAGTAALNLVNLSVSGWANQFYAAAAQAGSSGWKAALFGSLDPSNFITVDKPPASLWVMDLSMRLFGANSWSLLVPQALEGVAAVALVYATVRRISGPNAALIAGAALALTPVATLMFRYDNPDALLVLLMTVAGYATVRATEKASVRWLVLAGTVLGLAFLTKMLQGMLVVPAIAGTYLLAAPAPLGRRVVHLLAGGAAMVMSAGWWIALVEIWPAESRPYVGGSTDDSIVQLTLGYNGIGRVTGADNNGYVGRSAQPGFSAAQTGMGRLFGSAMASQIAWLIPAALIALVAVIVLTWRRPRTDILRAGGVLWGGWLLVTGLVLSYSSGIIHPYYTVALAPAVAALVGIGSVELWRRKHERLIRLTLATATAVTAIVGWEIVQLWQETPAVVVLVAGLIAAAALLLRFRRPAAGLVAAYSLVAVLAAPAGYAVQTVTTAHGGALPVAGPVLFIPPVTGPRDLTSVATQLGNGISGGTPIGTALQHALDENANRYRWVAATVASNAAASLELATNEPVMALGGYNGTDPAIGLNSFRALVSRGAVHYYVRDQSGFIGSTPARDSDADRIDAWVVAHFAAQHIDGVAVYSLSTTTAS